MKSLRKICFCGPFAVVLLAGVLAALYPRPAAKGSGITKANFDLIVKGMTQEEVEEIFGCPPGDYSTAPVVTISGGNCWWGDSDAKWIANDGIIIVRFNSQNLVASDIFSKKALKCYLPSCRAPTPGITARLRRCLGIN